jgi:hypothetical protein
MARASIRTSLARINYGNPATAFRANLRDEKTLLGAPVILQKADPENCRVWRSVFDTPFNSGSNRTIAPLPL